MRRIGNLFEQTFTRRALYDAYLDARKRKRGKRSCFVFEKNLSANIEFLHNGLMNGTYKAKPYYQFYVYEPKKRLISAPAFRDRVVQHAIYNVIRPIFDRKFIDHSYACRLGKGTHSASDYVHNALQASDKDSYVLQLDIRRYYYSLDREILRAQIEKVIKDKRMVDLVMSFAVTNEPLGAPIGNLLSQLFGLIYLNPLDHFVKRELKVKHYARYVDDFVLIGIAREQAIEYKARVIEFLDAKLHLSLSKSSIHKVSKGINFVGFRTWKSKRFVRKRALYIYRQSIKKGRLDSIVSSLGHARKTASYLYMLNYLKRTNNGLFNQLPKSIRSVHRLYSSRSRGLN
ncbi:MAG: reverse transcriptase/maturase family protein [Advenella sp.]|uniref:reverse transcriptase/maturase family protein n=1 Tax=Advenella sp. TaxID=1872388 RepID=UPI00258F4464|nr:reverse transcriptase/maturase family protein [Advenella sp.]MDD3757716.1 reverse transcriptase/maturase family protein [Advenella sp.]